MKSNFMYPSREDANNILLWAHEQSPGPWIDHCRVTARIAEAQGVCILEKRNLNVVMRSGFNEFTVKKWDSYFALKDYFDNKCDTNIYTLFYDEICKTSLLKYPY